MKNEIMRAIVGVPMNVGIEDGYEEAIEDFEITRSIGEDRTNHVERPIRLGLVSLEDLDLS